MDETETIEIPADTLRQAIILITRLQGVSRSAISQIPIGEQYGERLFKESSAWLESFGKTGKNMKEVMNSKI